MLVCLNASLPFCSSGWQGQSLLSQGTYTGTHSGQEGKRASLSSLARAEQGKKGDSSGEATKGGGGKRCLVVACVKSMKDGERVGGCRKTKFGACMQLQHAAQLDSTWVIVFFAWIFFMLRKTRA